MVHAVAAPSSGSHDVLSILMWNSSSCGSEPTDKGFSNIHHRSTQLRSHGGERLGRFRYGTKDTLQNDDLG